MMRFVRYFLTISFIGLSVYALQTGKSSSQVDESETYLRTTDPVKPLSAGELVLIEADSLYFIAEYENADSVYGLAIQSFLVLSDTARVLTAFARQTSSLGRLGLYEKARQLVHSALQTYGEAVRSHPIQFAAALSEEGRMLVRLDRFVEAEVSLSEAIQLLRRADLYAPMVEGYTLQAIGLMHHFQGKYDVALDYYQQSLWFLSQTDGVDIVHSTVPLNNIANIYYRKGKYEKATELHTKILAIRELWLPEDHPFLAMSFGNLGNVLAASGEFELAVDYHRKAATIWTHAFGTDHPELAASYNNMGRALTALGRYDEARPLLLNSLDQNIRLLGPNNDRTAISYGAVAEISYFEQQFVEAEAWSTKAIDVWEARELFVHPSYWSALRILALVYAETSRMPAALTTLQKVYRLSTVNPHPYSVKILNDLADLQIEERTPEATLRAVNLAIASNTSMALEVGGETNPSVFGAMDNIELLRSFRLKIDALMKVAETGNSIDNNKVMLATVERAAQLTDLLQRHHLPNNPNESIDTIASDLHGQAVILASDLYLATNEIRYISRAFYHSEKRKSQNLSSSLADTEARTTAQVDTSSVNVDREFKLEINRQRRLIAEKFASADADSAAISEMRNQLFNVERTYGRFVESISVRYDKYTVLRHGAVTVSPDQVQSEIIDDSTTLVEYVVFDSTLITFVIDRNRMNLVKATITPDFVVAIDSLHLALTEHLDRAYLRYAFATYTKLIKPIESLLKTERVIFVPEGNLHFVPFDMLLPTKPNIPTKPHEPVRFSQHVYFMEQIIVSYSYSATLLKQTNARVHAPTSNQMLAIAPVFSDGVSLDSTTLSFLKFNGYDSRRPGYSLGSLPGSKEEVEYIGDVFRIEESFIKRWFDSRTTVLIEKDASEDVIKSADLGTYKYVHIATHGFASSIDPSLSGMLLSPGSEINDEDGILRIEEVFSLNLNADLVVLSACDSGVGLIDYNEGVMSISRGFILAGANKLIVSLWPSNDTATKFLMVLFYDNLSAGLDPAAALRKAKVSLVKEGGMLARPQLWSGFIIMGS